MSVDSAALFFIPVCSSNYVDSDFLGFFPK